MKMRFAVVPLLGAFVATSAAAQAKPVAKPAARAAVKRKGTAEEIKATSEAALVALQQRWSGGLQVALVGANPCQLVLGSERKLGDLVTKDQQVVDVAVLGTNFEPDASALEKLEMVNVHLANETARVARTRQRVLEGVPQPTRTERTVFLTLLAPLGSKGTMTGTEALLAWSIACEPAS